MQNRKNNIITIILAVATSVAAYAQDTIITVKAEKIEAKITEIDIDVVRYKQYNYQDGPIIVIKKSDIDSIVFQNGQVTVFEQPQGETTQQEPIHTDTIEDEKTIDYESFKRLRDREMADFLKANDSESYAIFFRGETQKSMGRKLLIPSIVFTGIGVGSIAIGYVIIPLFGLITFNPILLYWWENNAHWFLRVGLSAIIMGQPFFIASIALQAYGGTLKKQAKNNYENKFFKNTTTLNFNLYPNGVGMSLKF